MLPAFICLWWCCDTVVLQGTEQKGVGAWARRRKSCGLDTWLTRFHVVFALVG